MNSNLETNEKRSGTESPLYRGNPKSLLQNPNIRWEGLKQGGSFVLERSLSVSKVSGGQSYLSVKVLHQIIRFSPFMCLLWKQKRRNRKSGINQDSFPPRYVSARWNPFYHNLGAKQCSYENYSSTSCRPVVTQKRWDSLQVGPSFIHRGEIAYWLQSVFAFASVCLLAYVCRSVCLCVGVCAWKRDRVGSLDDSPKIRVWKSKRKEERPGVKKWGRRRR